MSPKGKGGGKTPEMLVKLLNDAVQGNKISARSISRDTGLGLAPVSRYLKGTSEPSQASMEKLAAYFGVTVAYLRGEPGKGSTRGGASADTEVLLEELKGLLEIHQIVPDRLKSAVHLALMIFREQAAESLEFHGPNIGEEKTAEIHKLMDEVDSLQ